MTDEQPSEKRPVGRPPKTTPFPEFGAEKNAELLAQARQLVSDPSARAQLYELGTALVAVKTVAILKDGEGEALMKAMDRWDRIAGPATGKAKPPRGLSVKRRGEE